ncbi:choline dehydrogenase [Pseudomonas sp. BGM005]|nr:choline dehydrogenase [Pseudomonas sp. BG5]
MAAEHFDYIVVGAGSAGCVLANRLTASGKHNVLLIEAGGPDKSFWIKVPAGVGFVLANPSYVWPNLTRAARSVADRSIALLQGKTLGGSSSVNGMMYVRGQREDYDDWSAKGCPGWSWNEVLPYFKRSERLDEGGSEAHHGRTGELLLSWIKDLHGTSNAFMQAARQAGMPFNEDINSGHQEGVGYLLGTIHRGRRQSTARAFLHPVTHRRNLTVITAGLVRRVIFEGRCAVGVEYEDHSGQINIVNSRREVILSAGAIGSPHILQHSGVGDAAYLSSLGITPVANAPEVGRNLQDHLFGHMKFRVRKPGDSRNGLLRSKGMMALQALKWLVSGRGVMNTTTSQIVGFFKSCNMVERADLQLAMRPMSFHVHGNGVVEIDEIPAITVSAIQTRPFSRGQVRIASVDPREPSLIDPRYLSDERDINVLIRGMERIRQIMRQPAIASRIAEEIEPGPAANTHEALLQHLRNTAGTVYHPAGTCRMGSDERAVLDPRLRVRGVKRLRVIDASVMPTITSGNTNAPTIMIAEKGAEMVLVDS